MFIHLITTHSCSRSKKCRVVLLNVLADSFFITIELPHCHHNQVRSTDALWCQLKSCLFQSAYKHWKMDQHSVMVQYKTPYLLLYYFINVYTIYYRLHARLPSERLRVCACLSAAAYDGRRHVALKVISMTNGIPPSRRRCHTTQCPREELLPRPAI